MFAINAATPKWEQWEIDGVAPALRDGHGCAVINNDQALIFGGFGHETYNDITVLDLGMLS